MKSLPGDNLPLTGTATGTIEIIEQSCLGSSKEKRPKRLLAKM